MFAIPDSLAVAILDAIGFGDWREHGDFLRGEHNSFWKPLPFPESDRMFLVARAE